MSNMFYWCHSLTSIDVSGFDTSNVTDMNYMFYYCWYLTSLDISGLDTSNVTDMNHMFGRLRFSNIFRHKWLRHKQRNKYERYVCTVRVTNIFNHKRH